MGLNDFDAAIRLKEAVYKIAARAIEDLMPRPRYATVISVNYLTGRATCKYPDEGGTFDVAITAVAPGIGSVVRIAGSQGARYIDEVMTGAVINAGILGRRNLFHNGQHAVNQRQLASVSPIAAPSRLADRWNVSNNGVGVATLSWGTLAGFGPTPPAGRPQPATIQSVTWTTAEAAGSLSAGDYFQWTQAIEGVNLQHLLWGTASAQPVTISLDCYSTVAATYVAELYRLESTQRHIGQAFAVPAGFSTVALTFPGDTTTAITNDFAARLQFGVFVEAGSTYTGGGSLQTAWGNTVNNKRAVGVTNGIAATVNNVFSIINCQLEVGTAATQYEVRPFAVELEDAMRYFEMSWPFGTAIGAAAGATGAAWAWVFDGSVATRVLHGGTTFSVRKRVTPTSIGIYALDGTLGSCTVYNAATKLTLSTNSPSDRQLDSGYMNIGAGALTNAYYNFQWAA